MVQAISSSERLRRLRSLRARIDREIADEQARLARIVQLGRRLPVTDGPQPGPDPFSFDGDPLTAPPAVIREWARSEGIPVGARGFVAGRVRDAFIEAHRSVDQGA